MRHAIPRQHAINCVCATCEAKPFLFDDCVCGAMLHTRPERLSGTCTLCAAERHALHNDQHD